MPNYSFRDDAQEVAYQVWPNDESSILLHPRCTHTPNEREFPLYPDDLTGCNGLQQPLICDRCSGEILNETRARLHPEHKCKPLARALMMEGRDWWIGELLEPVAEWPHETHCLHMKTPLKDVSFLCNSGDFEQLLVLSNVIVKVENLPWLRATTAMAKARLLPPFTQGENET